MVTTYLQKLRLFSHDARLVLIAAVVGGFGNMGMVAVLLNLYLLRLGYGPEFVGLVNAAGWLAYAVASLPAGVLGARWGVRRVMIAGMSLRALGLGLLPLAEFVADTFQPGWLVATLALAYLGGASSAVNSTPFLMGATSEEERDHAFSVWSGLIPLAAFAGSLVAGLLPGLFASTMRVSLDHPAPYRYPLLIAAALLATGVVALLATSRPAAGQREPAVSDAGPLPFAPIAILALVYLLRSAGEAATITFFNVYLDAGLHVSTALVGTVMAVGQLLGVPAALAAPLAIARWGKAGTVGLGFLGMVLSLLPLALIPDWFVASLGLAGFNGMLSLISPAFLLLSQEAVSPGWRPAMSGAMTMGQGVSISALALGGGYAITAMGYRSPFSIAAALAVAGGLLFWACFLRVPRGELAGGPALESAE